MSAERIKALREQVDAERYETLFHKEEASYHEALYGRLKEELGLLEQDDAERRREVMDRFTRQVGEHSELFVDHLIARGHGQHWLSNRHVAIRLTGELPEADETRDLPSYVKKFNENWHPTAGQRIAAGEDVRFGPHLFAGRYVAFAEAFSERLTVKSHEDHGILYGLDAGGETTVVVMGMRG